MCYVTTTRSGNDQRETFLEGLVAYVLEHGAGSLSLRPLAAALGTSDRMLLYYFGTREQLLVAVLERVTLHLRTALDEALPAGQITPAQMLDRLVTVTRSAQVQPHLRLYVEISGLTAQGREPFTAATRAVAHAWLDWMAARLDVPTEERTDAAAGLLALVDGLLLVRFVVGDAVAEQAAAWWGRSLAP